MTLSLKQQCINTIFYNGIAHFQTIVHGLRAEPSLEDLKTVSHYATTFYGVSTSKLALVTGGNPESNNLFPEANMSDATRFAVREFLELELAAIHKQLTADYAAAA